MANAFIPALKLNEIFHLKGSKIKRKSTGHLSPKNLHKLKDMDFMYLYPNGIRIPTNIYQKLKTVIANDVKVLKKLNITDFSLVLGIRHLDVTETEMMQRKPPTGVAALLHMSNKFGLMHMTTSDSNLLSPPLEKKILSLSISYLKPLEMLHEKIDTNLYYNVDAIAYASLPIFQDY